jgi:hypothetical protein
VDVIVIIRWIVRTNGTVRTSNYVIPCRSPPMMHNIVESYMVIDTNSVTPIHVFARINQINRYGNCHQEFFEIREMLQSREESLTQNGKKQFSGEPATRPE